MSDCKTSLTDLPLDWLYGLAKAKGTTAEKVLEEMVARTKKNGATAARR